VFGEYTSYDALGLAELIRRKAVSPKEVLEAAIRRAESVNPTLNAIVTPLYDHAHARVANDEVAGPFAHVPFLLKDVHHALAGTPMSNCSRLQKGEVSQSNAEIVQRWLDAGLVVFGKTNSSEYKLSPATNPAVWGPTRSPWDAARTPGGSSGGSAAAVAAGIAPLASATDEGGSIRTPASNCGVFGLKPSRGRNPIGPDFGWELAGCSTSHVITRSVRDSAAALDVTSGPEPGSPYHCPGEGGFLDALAEPPATLRVGVCMDAEVFGRPMDRACVEAIGHTAKLLADLGHQVEEVSLPFDETEAARICLILIAVGFAGFVNELAEAYGASNVRAGIEPVNHFIWKAGNGMPNALFQKARVRAHALARTMAHFHERYDVLVTSTLCCAPKLIEEADPRPNDVRLARLVASPVIRPLLKLPGAPGRLVDTQLEALLDRAPSRTWLANFTGQPAMSVPLYQTENELPVGVQFLGPFGAERMLLQLAAQLEAAQPWAGRLPLQASRAHA
jgi:amidase